MKKIQYDMSGDCMRRLRETIGLEIQLIYTDRIIKEYQNPAFEANYLILKLNKSKLIKINTRWFECAETLDSYYRFTIEDIKYPIQAIKSIFSFINTDNIKNISVVKKEFKDDYFVTLHTCGILIERKDFKRVLITGGESALQNILLYDDEKYIFNFMKGCWKLNHLCTFQE